MIYIYIITGTQAFLVSDPVVSLPIVIQVTHKGEHYTDEGRTVGLCSRPNAREPRQSLTIHTR